MSTCSLAAPVHSDLVVRKSRFIGCVQPVADRAAAIAAVAGLRAAHPAATHVCWALMAGGEGAAVDDGEPSGTAGRPILEVLRRQELDGVLATVMRYFGGVKLGAGGLVRAYTDAVAQALVGAEKVRRVRRVTLRCVLPYDLEGRLRRQLALAGATLDGMVHGAAVAACFSMPEAGAAALRAALDEMSAGRIVWQPAPAPGGRVDGKAS